MNDDRAKHKYRIAAAVLIGGRSTRMGSPKEDMVVPGAGISFLDKICDEVDKCLGNCLYTRYLSVRKGQKRSKEGYITVEDEYDDIGPMGGLISVLKRAKEDDCDGVLLLACDMIRYTGLELENICSLYEGQDILFARTEGKDMQPLASIYSVRIIETAQRLAEAGDYRLRRLADHAVAIGYYDSENPDEYLNVNCIFFKNGV